MSKMKAALKTEEGEFEVEEVDRPEIPHPDWVLARIKVTGICGTDLRHWKKNEPELVHTIMGHELAAEIVEVGSAVTNVKPGDRVVVETLLGDGTCDWCRVQEYNLCPNLYKVRMKTVSQSFAEYRRDLLHLQILLIFSTLCGIKFLLTELLTTFQIQISCKSYDIKIPKKVDMYDKFWCQ